MQQTSHIEKLIRPLEVQRIVKRVRLINPSVRLPSIKRETSDNCKTCKEKEEFIKNLQAEIYRLQVIFHQF